MYCTYPTTSNDALPLISTALLPTSTAYRPGATTYRIRSSHSPSASTRSGISTVTVAPAGIVTFSNPLSCRFGATTTPGEDDDEDAGSSGATYTCTTSAPARPSGEVLRTSTVTVTVSPTLAAVRSSLTAPYSKVA